MPPGLFRRASLSELELSSLIVVLTDLCNFDCAYCDRAAGRRTLDFSALVKALDFFYPHFASECCIGFYGGEPLLAFGLLERAVEHLKAMSSGRGTKIRYSITTNGSLLNDDILGFLDDHGFSLTLSFDGLAQDVQRKKGSRENLTSLIPRIMAKPRISLTTNSVFSSHTVGTLADSLISIMEMGVPRFGVNLAHKPPWNDSSLLRLEEEISRVREYFPSHYQNPADVPWSGFSEELDRAVHRCPAGLDRMALSARGTLWGCILLAQHSGGKDGGTYSDGYGFGDVDSFVRDPGRIYAETIAHYSALRMDLFSTPDRACLICPEIEHCWICPVAAALATGDIGRIPGWRCRAAKILRKEKRLLLDRYGERLQRASETRPD